MDRWDYSTVPFDGDLIHSSPDWLGTNRNLLEVLKKLGDEGWELVEILYRSNYNGYLAVFKRRVLLE